MMTRKTLIPLLVAAVCACSTGEKEPPPVPRRTAYPRLVPYDTIRKADHVGPIAVTVNAEAETSRPDEDWLTVKFPRYGAYLYLSTVQTSSPDELLAERVNRHRRVAINMGNARLKTDTLTTPAGYSCELMTCYEGVTAPVHFIAVTKKGTLVYGAFAHTGTTEPADSVRPYVDEFKKEAIEVIKSLKQ